MTTQELILTAVKISIVLSVFALGLQATISETTLLFRHPDRLARTFVAMNIVMPAVALALALTLDLHPAVKIALVAISVSPVPPLFKNRAAKDGAHEDQVVATMAATAVLAIVFIPLAMEIVGKIAGVETHMSVGEVAKLVLVTMLVPMLAGIAVHKVAPDFAEKVSAPLAKFAMLLLVIAVLPLVIASGKGMFSLVGDGTLLAIAVFVLIGHVTGDLLGGPTTQNRRIMAIATATRHPAMAITIARTNFPDEKLAVPAVLLYMLVGIVVSAIYLKKRFPATQAQGA